MQSRSLILIFLISLITACDPTPARPTPDLVSTVVAGTLTAQPSATFTSIPSLTPSPTLSSASDYVFTTAQNVNLRIGPGMLFKVSRVMAQGTRLQVLALARGGDWMHVSNEEGIFGWVGVDFVSDSSQFAVIFIEPEDVRVVSGRVVDEAGQPVEGIGFAVYQGNGANARRTDAATDGGGFFYAYLPPTMSGDWTVEFVSIACPSSVLQPPCDCPNDVCGHADPEIRTITLPFNDLLTYTWVD